MARRVRYHYPHGFYHVILRGNSGQEIFFQDKDRSRMSSLIQEGIEKFGHSIHAFCFMENHVHLLVQVDTVSLSQIMQNISFRYTRYINWSNNRTGHLFQGRYKALLVDAEGYLKELARYIHLNPVRAGLVSLPEEYQWSSHNRYLGGNGPSWVTTEYVLSRFGLALPDARKRYKEFVHAGIGLNENIALERGISDGVLGNEKFAAAVAKSPTIQPLKCGVTLGELIQIVCHFYGVDKKDVKNPGKVRSIVHVRRVLAHFVREIEHITLEELAAELGVAASSLCKNAAHVAAHLDAPAFRKEIPEIRKLIL